MKVNKRKAFAVDDAPKDPKTNFDAFMDAMNEDEETD